MQVFLRHCVWGIAVAGAAGCGRSQDGLLDVQIHDQLVAFNAAVGRADTSVVRSLLADDLIWVIGVSGVPVSKAQLLAAAGTPQHPVPQFDVDSLHVRRVGDAAIVDYRRTDRRHVGGYDATVTWRVFETYVRTGHQWQVARHMQTWIHRPQPAPAAVDSAGLARVVGHYEIDPSYIDNVHFEGCDLVATATGQTEGAHLLPVSETAFLPVGVGQLLVFERDSKGRVVGYVQGYPDGRVLRARKID